MSSKKRQSNRQSSLPKERFRSTTIDTSPVYEVIAGGDYDYQADTKDFQVVKNANLLKIINNN